MIVSDECLSLIREFEGVRLTAYPDPGTGGAPWTIGYGHTHGVKKGDKITQAQAQDYLAADCKAVAAEIASLVHVPLSAGQAGALISFTFNVGGANLAKSTLLRKVNAGDFKGAADELLKWNKAAGHVMPGLTRRRAAERQLFLSHSKEQTK